MQDILDLILFCIVFAFLWHTIMNSQRYAYGEYEDLFDDDDEKNLTMEENPIKITIDNYKNETRVYEIPQSARVSICTVRISDIEDKALNIEPIVGMSIEVEVTDKDKFIKIIEEDI